MGTGSRIVNPEPARMSAGETTQPEPTPRSPRGRLIYAEDGRRWPSVSCCAREFDVWHTAVLQALARPEPRIKGVRISTTPLTITYPTVAYPPPTPPPPAKPPLTDLQKQQNAALLQFRDSLSPNRWAEFKAFSVRYANGLARVHAGEPGADVAAKEAVVNLCSILLHQVQAALTQREYLRLNPAIAFTARGGAA